MGQSSTEGAEGGVGGLKMVMEREEYRDDSLLAIRSSFIRI